MKVMYIVHENIWKIVKVNLNAYLCGDFQKNIITYHASKNFYMLFYQSIIPGGMSML